jgi:hypothetical protein
LDSSTKTTKLRRIFSAVTVAVVIIVILAWVIIKVNFPASKSAIFFGKTDLTKGDFLCTQVRITGADWICKTADSSFLVALVGDSPEKDLKLSLLRNCDNRFLIHGEILNQTNSLNSEMKTELEVKTIRVTSWDILWPVYRDTPKLWQNLLTMDRLLNSDFK